MSAIGSSSTAAARARLLCACALAVAAAAAAPGAVAAAEPCGETLLADWTEDGRLDGVYAPRCYRDALARLPEDVRTYSSAPEDIAGALYRRVRSLAETPARKSQPTSKSAAGQPKRTLASSAPAVPDAPPQAPPVGETRAPLAADPSVLGAVAAVLACLLVIAALKRRHS